MRPSELLPPRCEEAPGPVVPYPGEAPCKGSNPCPIPAAAAAVTLAFGPGEEGGGGSTSLSTNEAMIRVDPTKSALALAVISSS
jgi:hypothetical protein